MLWGRGDRSPNWVFSNRVLAPGYTRTDSRTAMPLLFPADGGKIQAARTVGGR